MGSRNLDRAFSLTHTKHICDPTSPIGEVIETFRQCVDAASSGSRVLFTTQGSLLGHLSEDIAKAIMSRTPLVIVHRQGIGPGSDASSEGLDGDVMRVRHIAPCGVCMPVLAPTDAASLRELTSKAFDLAARLSMPMLLLTSPHVTSADDQVDVPKCEPAGPATPPPAFPTDEDSSGFAQQLEHLRRTLEDNRSRLELVAPEIDADAHTLVLSYGGGAASARTAVGQVRNRGIRSSLLILHSLWPVPENALRRARTPHVNRVLVAELNPGLYADELRKHLHGVKIEPITRCDGKPIDPKEIVDRLINWPCG